MAKIPYYKVKVGPKPTANFFKSGIFKNRRGQQLMISIIGIYLVAGGILGLFLFSSGNKNSASASQPAGVSSSIRFIKSDKFSVGQDIDLLLTIQNTSITNSINNLNVELLSTREAVKWNQLKLQGTPEQTISPSKSNYFTLPSLASGQRAEFIANGSLVDNTLDFVTVLGKISYTNEAGNQESDTNRIYSNLKPSNRFSNKPLTLKISKEQFAPGEDVPLTLQSSSENYPLDSTIEGKIYITKRDTGEVVASFDCIPGDKGLCDVVVKNLGPGNYSSFFMHKSDSIYSDITWFAVSGNTVNNQLVPSDQASLELPFGAQSINGIVPVISRRVVNQNQSPDNSSPCVYQILRGTVVVSTVTASVGADRGCRYDLSAGELKAGDGVYTIKLANSGLTKDVSFVNKPAGLLTLGLVNPLTQKGQNVEVKTTGINDTEGDPLVSENLTLYVYQAQSGSLQSTTNLFGDKLQVKDGVFSTTIPGSYFQSGGNYAVYFVLDSGRQSDFLTLSLSDKNYAFSDSGVIISDYSKLRVGEDVPLALTGISDKDGSIVNSGSCLANFYGSSNSIIPVSVAGEIKSGVCQVVLTADKVTTSGPLLISFQGQNNNSSINQSKQVFLAPGTASKFGQLNFQYEPVRKNYANNLVVGPVTDKFGNLTNSFGQKLLILNAEGETIQSLTDIDVIDGYAKINIASSVLNSDKLIFKFQDSASLDLLTREVELIQDNSKLILPEILDNLNNDNKLEINWTNIEAQDINNCNIRLIKTTEQFIDQQFDFNTETKSCQLKWDLNQYRDLPKALAQMTVGNIKFNNLISIQNGEAANIFTVHPSLNFNNQKELEVSLMTSPIIDRFGRPVVNGSVSWKYNGKIDTSPIENGFAKLNILAKNLESRDIRTAFDQRFLDLDLDVKASVSSINQTNNVSVYIGNFDLANQIPDFRINQGSNYITLGNSKIFKFDSPSCNAIVVSNNFSAKQIKTHKQGSDCYAQVTGDLGKNTLIYEDNGYTVGSFNFTVGDSQQEVEWCKNDGEKCRVIQVLAPLNSKVEAIIYDDDKQYKFTGNELENIVQIEQNGLNPLKEYPVEITYTNTEGLKVSHYQKILGQRLAQ
jgi:hypothetical protein